jgi:hypothetical protein
VFVQQRGFGCLFAFNAITVITWACMMGGK